MMIVMTININWGNNDDGNYFRFIMKVFSINVKNYVWLLFIFGLNVPDVETETVIMGVCVLDIY